MDVVVIANPRAGPGRRRLECARAPALLRERGLTVELRVTSGPGDATRLAAAAAAAGAPLVVAVGGDGTVHETALGLVGTGTALGVLPCGSGNDFARGVGCPTLAAGLEAVSAGEDRALDVAHVDGDRFINSLGLFAAGAVSGRAATYWRFLGGWRYTLATVVTLVRERPWRVTWELDDGTREETEVLMAEICNGPTTGGGFRLAPDAVFDDGRLDVFAAGPIGPLPALRLLPRAIRGERLEHPAITYHGVRTLRFASERPVPYHRDGEPGVLPAGEHSVGLLEEKLLVRMPARGPAPAEEKR